MNRHSTFRLLAIGIISFWLLVFVFLPNLMVVIVSFLERDAETLVKFSLSLESYLRLFNPLYLEIVWNSFVLAGTATLICLLVAYPFARVIATLPKGMRPAMLFLLILPFWTNSLIRTYALKNILGREGLLNEVLLGIGILREPLELLYTNVAVIMGLVYILLPFMVFPIYSSIEKLDGRLLEAAKDLGANAWQRFFRIELPLAQPGIIAGVLLVFLPAMGMFYVADLLGGAKHILVGNLIQKQFLKLQDWPFGAAASVTLTVAMGLLLFAYWRASRAIGAKGDLDD